MFKFYLIFISFFIGIVFGLPMKDHDFDNSVLQNKLRQLNLFEDEYIGDNPSNYRHLDSIGLINSLRNIPITVDIIPKSERILKNMYYSTDEKNSPFSKNKWNMDQERLYYYAPKMIKSYDNIPAGNLIRDMESADGGHQMKRTLDSIGGNARRKMLADRNIIQGKGPLLLVKYPFTYYLSEFEPTANDVVDGLSNNSKDFYGNLNNGDLIKRNFDEIDRAGFTNFKRNSDENGHAGVNKITQKFDDIDRIVFPNFKRNFDEIDRAGFTNFKRNMDGSG